MSKQEQFNEEINAGYTFKGDSIILGGAMLDGECQTNTLVNYRKNDFIYPFHYFW